MRTRRQLLIAAVPAGFLLAMRKAMTTAHTTHQTSSHATAAKLAQNARAIDAIYRSPGLHWVGDGFRVAGYFSAIPDAMRKLDPFLMLDYHPEYDYAPTEHPRGVGVHPHRGFETVTFAFKGSVAHHDSTGGGGVIGPGDVQWMTAASGILHKEYHEQSYGRRGGPFQMIQLWVNLPRAHKMAPPAYQPIVADQIGIATLPEGAGTVRVVAGEYEGARGPARTFTPINIYDAKLNAGGKVAFEFPSSQTAALLIMKGDVTINGEAQARANDFVLFAKEGERIAIEASSEAQVFVLNGEPINEPIVQHGPFVMNTRQEIVQAMSDYSRGLFGHLDD